MNSDNEYYWHDSEFIKYDSSFLSSLGFDNETIEVLSVKGLPTWAAPNINFDRYELVNDALQIGSDRDEQDIFLEVGSGKVLYGKQNGFVNSSAKALRETLKAYAEMIEKVICMDKKAATENRIPDDLVLEFKSKLSVIDNCAIEQKTFWMKEIERRLGHI